MFSEIEDLLVEDEEIKETVRPSKADTRYVKGYSLGAGLTVLIAFLIFGLNMLVNVNIFIALLLVFAPLLIAAKTELDRKFVMYHFTDRKIVVERGILNKEYKTINYDKITHMDTEESFQERMFDVGDIHLHAAGEDKNEIILNGIKDVNKYRKLINQHSN